MQLRDAHVHYHFASLAPVVEEALEEARKSGLGGAVVNGTCEEDWPAVREFVSRHSWTRAAYGIHPWQARHRLGNWESTLRAYLLADPTASVGEIGMDAWVEGHDLTDQTDLFLRQWHVALELRRPVTIHCIQAWEPLRQVLQRAPDPARGFLIHAYNGPPDWIPWLADKGAYFSFSPHFLLERKRPQREAFRLMPRERILIETDSPALSPPQSLNPFPLTDPVTGGELNHPANIATALRSLAGCLAMDPADAADLTTGNFERLFGG